MSIEIRKMEKADIPACADIVENTELFKSYRFTGEAASEILTKALDQPQADLRVAIENQQIQGFAWVVKKGGFDRASYLRLLAVHPKATGKKYGAALLDAMEETHLTPYGFFLLVTADNVQARRFYERRGYHYLGTIPGFVKPGIDECIYFKAP